MKTSAALLLACQTVNAISLERVKQLSVRRGNDLYSMEAMINEKMEIQPQDQIIDAESGTITVIPGAAAPQKDSSIPDNVVYSQPISTSTTDFIEIVSTPEEVPVFPQPSNTPVDATPHLFNPVPVTGPGYPVAEPALIPTKEPTIHFSDVSFVTENPIIPGQPAPAETIIDSEINFSPPKSDSSDVESEISNDEEYPFNSDLSKNSDVQSDDGASLGYGYSGESVPDSGVSGSEFADSVASDEEAVEEDA